MAPDGWPSADSTRYVRNPLVIVHAPEFARAAHTVWWITLVGVRDGKYEAAFGLMLLTVTTTAVFVALIWWNARSLYQLDADLHPSPTVLGVTWFLCLLAAHRRVAVAPSDPGR